MDHVGHVTLAQAIHDVAECATQDETQADAHCAAPGRQEQCVGCNQDAHSDADDDNDSVLTKDENVDGKDGPMSDDTDLDGIANYLDVDDDNDSILTKVELTGPQPADVDGDGKLNYLDTDADGDTLPDAAEWSTGSGDRLRDCTAVTTICFANDADKDQFANFVDTDSDGDGLLDKDELADSDGDGVPDWLDTDVFAVGERIYLPIVRR